MNIKRILSTFTLSALMIGGLAIAVFAQEGPVSGAPSGGFFEGTVIEALGDVIKEQIDLEAPSLQVTVEGRTIRLEPLNLDELAAVQPEASINPQSFEVTAYPQLRFRFKLK